MFGGVGAGVSTDCLPERRRLEGVGAGDCSGVGIADADRDDMRDDDGEGIFDDRGEGLPTVAKKSRAAAAVAATFLDTGGVLVFGWNGGVGAADSMPSDDVEDATVLRDRSPRRRRAGVTDDTMVSPPSRVADPIRDVLYTISRCASAGPLR